MKAAPDEADLLKDRRMDLDPASDSERIGGPPPSASAPLTAPGSRRRRWPAPLTDAAYHGLAGRFVRLVGPETEADPAALLFQFLLFFGVAVARGIGFYIGATWHGLNEYLGLIGDTGTGKKGTSFEEVRNVFELADPDFVKSRLKRGGLASGEGLKGAVRDARDDDPGEPDKRLLVYEPEFASVLKKSGRDGNTLSTVIREAWESGNLCNLTVKDSITATGAHVGIVAHTTEDDLRDLLRGCDVSNGFVNRFLWIAVRGSKLLPHGGAPDPSALHALAEELKAALASARGAGEVSFDSKASALWEVEYVAMNRPQPGAFGHATARGPAHVRRLAAIYACLDRSTSVSLAHLRAALECWRYVSDTGRMVFGGSTGDDYADRILALLRDRPDGMTKTEITDAMNRNKVDRINRALERLEEDWGLIVRRKDALAPSRKGRPPERFFVVDPTKETKEGG